MNTQDTGASAWHSAPPEERIRTARTFVCAGHPHLSGLAAAAEVMLGDYVKTAGVTASGKILIAPGFFNALSLRDLVIILTHELLHLFRRVHKRAERAPDPELFNIADDFIINDIISRSLDCRREETVLRHGLIWEQFLRERKELQNYPARPAHTYSLEEMVFLLRTIPGAGDMAAWDELCEGWLEKALRKSKRLEESENSGSFRLDVIGSELERDLFSGKKTEGSTRGAIESGDLARKAMGEYAALSIMDAIFVDAEPGSRAAAGRLPNRHVPESGYHQMLRDAYDTPWESTLQHWFDSSMPGERSWARPSRRGSWRTDVVLPGRKRWGWILNMILDVDPSMLEFMPMALGALCGFCEANHVETIRLIQVGDDILVDEHRTPEELANAELKLRNPRSETPQPSSSATPEAIASTPQPEHWRAATVQMPSSPQRIENIAPRGFGDRKPRRNFKRTEKHKLPRPGKRKPLPLPFPALLSSPSYETEKQLTREHEFSVPGLASAFRVIEEDFETQSVVVVTNGRLAFPPAPDVDVLWALVGEIDVGRFNPPYGTAVHIWGNTQ